MRAPSLNDRLHVLLDISKEHANSVVFGLWITGCLAASYFTAQSLTVRYLVFAALWAATLPIRTPVLEMVGCVNSWYRDWTPSYNGPESWRASASKILRVYGRSWKTDPVLKLTAITVAAVFTPLAIVFEYRLLRAFVMNRNRRVPRSNIEVIEDLFAARY
jgi:hypothetical protein